MEKAYTQIPFLRSVLFLALGIITGSFYTIPLIFTIPVSALLLSAAIYINSNYAYKYSAIFGVLIHLFIFFSGITIFNNYNKKPQFTTQGIFVTRILEKPLHKANSFKTVAEINSIIDGEKVFFTNEKIIIYFNSESDANKLKPGDIIEFRVRPQPIKNFGNPFEFDYKKYLGNKRIYRQVYLPAKNIKKISAVIPATINIKAEQIRERLLNIYRRRNFDKKELEILSALTLGYKRELDPETKRVFSNAGAMHILAVSGLHVGIIMWIITILFGFIRKTKNGRICFIIISIILLWSYAFITGLSPSVMRAATMFSVYVVGDNIGRRANNYNSLAASAMLLLIINPNNLFDVGFQLSYSAVFGILFLQPRLSKLAHPKNLILKFFWSLITVSVAVQVTTFPITLFYFDRFPSYFWLTNLIVIPVATALIPLGISLLFLNAIPIISDTITTIIELIIKWSYYFMEKIDNLPLSVLTISITPLQLLFLTGTVISLFLFISSNKAKYLKTMLILLLGTITTSLIFNIKQNKISGFIVFNSPEKHTVQLIKGHNSIIISTDKSGRNNIPEFASRVCCSLKLNPPVTTTFNDTLRTEYLCSENGIIVFDDKTILVDKYRQDLNKNINFDFMITFKKNGNRVIQTQKKHSVLTHYKKLIKNNTEKNSNLTAYTSRAFIEKW